MSISKNLLDRQHNSHIENSIDGGDDRRVNDSIAHAKLDTIASGLGVSNTTPVIYNITIVLADTEQFQTLPVNTKKFIIKSRNKGIIRLGYNVGDTSTSYLEIKPGSSYEDDNYYTNQTIYFRSTKVGDTIEILAYS